MTEMAERLAALKRQDWPRLSVDAITEERDPWPAIREDPEKRALVDAHLKRWVPGECPFCEWGRFSWGIVYGGGFCTCGWPGRLYHIVKDAADIEVVRFDAVLWAHPYTVHTKKAAR